MENITPTIPAGRQVIDSYAPGRFRVAGISYPGSVIVFPDRTMPWPIGTFDDVELGALAAVTEAQPVPELLLLGAGTAVRMPPKGLRLALRELGIGLEIMETGAACRTYNILLAEGRSMAAALIALPPRP